ncbi:SapC family protein [Spiribacter halobius]|nr:SapC family protein [Spiribacter halobius]UEX79922.1 SapC family protein [Spiribacter halobius]
MEGGGQRLTRQARRQGQARRETGERFRAEMERTAEFGRRLAELGLLVKKDLQITDGEGRRYRLQDFRIVDEAKLAGVDDATLGELHGAGQLGWIYAHLISLGSATRLPARLAGTAGSDEQASVETTEPTP